MSADGAGPATPDDAVEAVRSRQVALIGQRIRELRHPRMTLSELSQACNVSIGLLSRLENGVGNPAFAALSAIARALDVDVSAFFERASEEGRFVGKDDRVRLGRTGTDAELELLVPDFSSRIIAMVMTLPPGYAPAETAAHRGQQFEVLLEGAVEYRIEQERHELEPGDLILFEASRPHARHNLSRSATAKIFTAATEARLESYFPPRS
jgi:transcriptional regulator with XRE-family HTH domain